MRRRSARCSTALSVVWTALKTKSAAKAFWSDLLLGAELLLVVHQPALQHDAGPGVDQRIPTPHFQPLGAGQLHGMRQNLGALIVVAGCGELVGKRPVMIEIADFICRHDRLQEALANTYPACLLFARTWRECRMTFELQPITNCRRYNIRLRPLAAELL